MKLLVHTVFINLGTYRKLVILLHWGITHFELQSIQHVSCKSNVFCHWLLLLLIECKREAKIYYIKLPNSCDFSDLRKFPRIFSVLTLFTVFSSSLYFHVTSSYYLILFFSCYLSKRAISCYFLVAHNQS